MAQNSASSSFTQSSSEHAQPGDAKPPEVVALFAKVDALLKEGSPEKALALVGRAKIESPWLKHAVGVCQLRMGHTQAAVELFRGMVVSGHLEFRHDVPTVWKTNFATALLVTNNLSGCLNALAEVKDQNHPGVVKLRAAIDQWKKGLTLWQKFLWYTGSEPSSPVELGFPPGDLE